MTTKHNLFDFTKYLIQLGGDVNKCDKNEKWTPLMFAVQNKNFKLTQMLLEKGANVNAKDVDGFDALTIAVDSKNMNMCKFLLKYKPKIDNPKELLEILQANRDKPLFVILKDYYFMQKRMDSNSVRIA